MRLRGTALLFRVIILSAGAAMLMNCSLVNPHVKWDQPGGTYKKATDITLDDGIQYAENAKASYMSALGQQSHLTSWLGIGLIPVTATALGLGLTGQGSTAITVLGLTAASGYALGTLFYSKPNQLAWLLGYNATTCAIDAVTPLLYVEKNKEDIENKIGALDVAIEAVEGKVGNVKMEVHEIESNPPAALGEAKKLAEQRITEAEKLLADSRETRRVAEKMLQDASIAGVALKQTVDRISGQVSRQIVENAADIQALSSLIGGLATSYGQFTTVPEGLRSAPPRSGAAQGGTASVDLKVSDLNMVIAELETMMIVLQGATIRVADIVNGVASGKPIETLKACGVNVEKIAQPLTVEPSGRIELQAGKAATVGRVIRGGSAPYAVTLQGDPEGPMVRQTEPFGPAFTVQITANTPAKEYSIYISDKAGQRLFIAVDVKSGGPATEPALSSNQPDNLNKTNLEKTAIALNKQTPKDTFSLSSPDVTVTIIKAEVKNNRLLVSVEIKAQNGGTTNVIVKNTKDDEIKNQIAMLMTVKNFGIQKENIDVQKRPPSK